MQSICLLVSGISLLSVFQLIRYYVDRAAAMQPVVHLQVEAFCAAHFLDLVMRSEAHGHDHIGPAIIGRAASRHGLTQFAQHVGRVRV